jgi:hypothetical protein
VAKKKNRAFMWQSKETPGTHGNIESIFKSFEWYFMKPVLH